MVKGRYCLIFGSLLWILMGLVLSNSAMATDSLYVYFGSVNDTIFNVHPGDTVNMNVYFMCTAGAYVADIRLPLVTNDSYVSADLANTRGTIYYPFNQWDDASFLATWEGSPPNPSGFHSRSFLGFADIGGSPNPWMHLLTPTRALVWPVVVTNSTAFGGMTIEPFRQPAPWYMSAGDTLGGPGYEIVVHLPRFYLINPPVYHVDIWYGKVDGSPVYARIGDTTSIAVYAQTSYDAFISRFHLCLGTQDSYIDSAWCGEISYEFDSTSCRSLQHSPPNAAGWSSISFLGYTGSANPYFHSSYPVKIGSIKILAINDSALVNDTIAALAAGVNSVLGVSYVRDSLGGNPYTLFQHFSPIFFHLNRPESCDYIPGDFNNDGELVGGDVTYGVRFFKGLCDLPPFRCYNDSTDNMFFSPGDITGNCELQANDITRLVFYFKGTATISYCPWTPPRSR
jgi:hypothetical protein